MMIMKIFYAPFAAALVAVALGFSSCGNDDTPSGPGLDFGEKYVSGYKTDYSITLSDPNVHEVADVLATYIDADGSEKNDTVEGQKWTKTVVMAPGTSQTYGLALHFASKPTPVLTQDEYDFGADITSHVTVLYSNGTSMALMWPKGNVFKGILRPDNDGNFRTVRASSYLVTPQAREDIDTTMVYFNFTNKRLESGKDTLIYNKFSFD